jgi:hypothetical protein
VLQAFKPTSLSEDELEAKEAIRAALNAMEAQLRPSAERLGGRARP